MKKIQLKDVGETFQKQNILSKKPNKRTGLLVKDEYLTYTKLKSRIKKFYGKKKIKNFMLIRCNVKDVPKRLLGRNADETACNMANDLKLNDSYLRDSIFISK